MNIFLTGKINCGKSTIINQFQDNYSGSICGYKTVRAKTCLDDFFGVYLLDIKDSDNSLDLENKVGDCFENKSLICYENIFNSLGVSILENYQHTSLVIMDEIGVLEKDCERFKKMIIECLDSHTSVLGVIKQKDSIFLNYIRARNDVLVIEVTPLNNQDVLKELIRIFCL